MRARQRHLNPKAAGAALVLDARYITGLNNNDAVTTWPDRSGNAYDPTQSTGFQRPVYKTNQISGNPVITFDGSNDYLSFGTPLDFTGFVVVVKTSTTAPNKTFLGVRTTQAGVFASHYCQLGNPARTTTWYRLTTGGLFGATAGVVTSGTASIVSGSRSDTALKVALNGVFGTEGTTSNPLSDVSTTTFVGAGWYNNAIVDYWAGDLASVIGITGTRPTDGLLKRLQNSSALSYKIACS
jgi:hypothetical protein